MLLTLGRPIWIIQYFVNITHLLLWSSGFEWSGFLCINCHDWYVPHYVRLMWLPITIEKISYPWVCTLSRDHYYIWWMFIDFIFIVEVHSFWALSSAYFLSSEKYIFLGLGLRFFSQGSWNVVCCQWGWIAHSQWIYWRCLNFVFAYTHFWLMYTINNSICYY